MRSTRDDVITRRFALGAVAAGAVGIAMPRQVQVRAIIQRGVFGGGLAGFENGEAQFSLFASKFTFDDQGPDIVIGSVVWIDGSSGQTFVSTEVTDYEAVESTTKLDEVRTIRGMMRVDDADEYPFTLTVTDGGLPGTGVDAVALIVGSGAEGDGGATVAPSGAFTYAVAGTVIVGDLQGIDVDITGAEARDAESKTTQDG